MFHVEQKAKFLFTIIIILCKHSKTTFEKLVRSNKQSCFIIHMTPFAICGILYLSFLHSKHWWTAVAPRPYSHVPHKTRFKIESNQVWPCQVRP